jgi:DNA-3-methyladenine glycosylase II
MTMTDQGASADSAAARYTYAKALTPRAPYSLAQTLRFITMFTAMDAEQTIAGGTLTKAITLNGRAVVFALREAGTIKEPRLALTLTSATPLDDAERAALRDRVHFFLSLDDDLSAFYATAQADPAMAAVIARLYGLHQPKFLTPLEIACWATLVQRTPIAIAHRVKARITDRYGSQLTVNRVEYRAFPEAATLAAADPAELDALIGVARKAEYFRAVVDYFARADEFWLRSAPVGEVAAALRGVRGIGAWSTTFILVRGLGRMDADLATSETLGREVSRIYGHLPDEAEQRALLTRYAHAAGYWLFYCRNAFGTGDHRRAQAME